jgi:putative PEP-CTERM system histidine kinase
MCLLVALVIVAAGRSWAARLSALACTISAAAAAAIAIAPGVPLTGIVGILEILRSASWLLLLLVFCWRVGGSNALPLLRRFAIGGVAAALFALTSPVLPGLGHTELLAQLGLALIIVLVAENLYRNSDEGARWHTNLPAIALGGLAAFDVLLHADGALSAALSPALLDARAVLTALVIPLLAVAAVRDRRWQRPPVMSRQVVFHGATLVIAGIFLLGIGATSEALRRLGGGWSEAAQASLLAGAVMVLAVGATSRSVRSRVRGLVVDHFFSGRYDYRQEWLRCVTSLSAPDTEAPPVTRAIRAIADAVDSPAGALLLRSSSEARARFTSAGAWNLYDGTFDMPGEHALLAALREGGPVAGLNPAAAPDLCAAFGEIWLAVPLIHHSEGLMGVVLLAPPRAPFALDWEVFELLRTLGREVAMFLAERHAAERLAEQRQVQDYAKRFAFVAHDVKTVSSQLGLLLANAEENIVDPEFQRDMLLTVRASVTRINTLIARLGQPGDEPLGGPIACDAHEQLERIAGQRRHSIEIEADARVRLLVVMPAERFDAAITHLLDNALEASQPGQPVRIRLRHDNTSRRAIVDIVDSGPGMTPEFIRSELFRPLSTSKPRGSGIGAWQARELLREVGGDLTVLSRPGVGTTMRLSLPLAESTGSSPKPAAALPREMHL